MERGILFAANFIQINGTLIANAKLPAESNWRALLVDSLDQTASAANAYAGCIDANLKECYDGVVVKASENLSKLVFRSGMLFTLYQNKNDRAALLLTDFILRQYLAPGGDIEAVYQNHGVPKTNSSVACWLIVGCSADRILTDNQRFGELLDKLKGKGGWDDAAPLNAAWTHFNQSLQSLKGLAALYLRSGGGMTLNGEQNQGALAAIISVSAPSSLFDRVSCTAEGAQPTKFTFDAGATKTQQLAYAKVGAYRLVCKAQKGRDVSSTLSLAISFGEWPTGQAFLLGNCVTPAITSISPNTAQAGVTTQFSIVGRYLPLTATATMAGATCAAPTNQTGVGFSIQCTLDSVGAKAVSVFPSVGGAVIDSSQTVGVTERSLSSALTETFDSSTLDASKWNIAAGPGGYSIANGFFNAGNRTSINTAGKVIFSGSKIVVEARMGGTEVSFLLIDANVPNAANAILASNTTYRGWGLDIQATGSFKVNSVLSGGSLTPAETIYVATNGVLDSGVKFYRLTLDGSKATLERGANANSISGKLVATLSASVTGRRFYLLVGTGTSPYAPGTFDWVTINVLP